jgi:hypothetical protein
MSEPATPRTPLYATPEGRLQRPLRVVLLGPRQVPGWVHAFMGQAFGCDWLELVALVVPDAVLPMVHGVGVDMRAFVVLDRTGRSVSPTSLVPAAMPPGTLEASSTSLHARVAALAPDLVILFGPQAWISGLAELATWGCWHVDASLTDPRHAGLSLLAPMLRDEAATLMELVLQAGSDPPVHMARSWGRTRAVSFLVQREDAFRKLPSLLLRSLHRVAAGHVPCARRSEATLQLQAQPPLPRTAGLRAMLSTSRASMRSFRARFRNDRGWTLVLRDGGTLLDPQAPVIGACALLKAPKGWWADPWALETDGRKLLFVEEMAEPKTWKANIACVELIDGGARRLGIVLDEPGHLSFPQVFGWEGQWYMTVESGYDRRVSLYRATDFPLQWVRIRDLVTGRACVDPTLHHQDGRWYLFANAAEGGNSTCDDLFLFLADSLEGPFEPHPANPIVSDVRRARPAGRLFHHQGRLIRPSQDCAIGYGKALVFNEVLELGPTVYRERTLSRLAPDWAFALDGCHTYNHDGSIEVLDVLGYPPADTACLRVFDGHVADAIDAGMRIPPHLGPVSPGMPRR